MPLDPYHIVKWETKAVAFWCTVSKLNRQCNNAKPSVTSLI